MTRPASRATLRPVRPRGWWFDGLMVALFVAVTVPLAAGWRPLLDLDVTVAHWSDTHRPPLTYWPAWVLNHLGQGGALTLITLVMGAVLAYRERTSGVRALRWLLPTVTAFLLTGFAILPLKLWSGRQAPHTETPHPELFFADPPGMSYPSGHMVNSFVWYFVLALLLGALLRGGLDARWRWAIRVVPPVVLAITTVYLGYHWITDTVAGLFLGVFLGRLMARIPWPVPSGPTATSDRADGR